MRSFSIALLALAACGRIGFGEHGPAGTDGRSADDAAGSDTAFDAEANVLPAPFAARFGGTMNDGASIGIRRDHSGNLYFIGTVIGAGDLDGVSLPNAGEQDVLLVSLRPDGTQRWATTLGGPGSDSVNSLAIDEQDNLYITGAFEGTAVLGAGPVTSGGGSDAFVASFTSAGVNRFTRAFGSSGDDEGNDVAVDSLGNVYVSGFFSGSVDFGGGGPITAVGNTDAFVASYTGSGTYRWSHRYGGTDFDQANALAVIDDTRVAVAGMFRGTATFQTTPLTSAGSDDVFVAILDSAIGAVQDVAIHGSTGTDYPELMVATGGALFSVGEWNVTGTGYPPASFSHADSYIARIGFDGSVAFWNTYPAAQVAQLFSIAPTAQATVLIAGELVSTTDFGGGTLTAQGADGVIIELGLDGSYRHSGVFGGANDQALTCLTPDSDGSWVIGGVFFGTLALGSGTLTSAGASDGRFARIAPLW